MYDYWKLNSGREDEISQEEINRYRHERLNRDMKGCSDCKYCEEQGGKFYCLAYPEKVAVREDDICDGFDDNTDWAEEYVWNH